VITYNESLNRGVGRDELRTLAEGTACFSCRKEFKPYDLLHTKARRNENGTVTVRRHLICALYHKVITVQEAKKDAPQYLKINWQDINKAVKDLDAEKRKSLMVMARAYTGIIAGSLMLATWSLIVFLNA